MNKKGGVGKTSFTAGIAGVLAAANYRVLVIDLDPQGEQAMWHGLDDGDDGDALATSLLGGPLVIPVRSKRAGLDLIRGGYLLDRFVAAALPVDLALQALRPQVDALAQHYDYILIDSPPGERTLRQAVAGTEPFVVVPVDLSSGAMRGLDATAAVIAEAREHDYNTQLAGIALINVQPSKKHLAEAKLKSIRQLVGGVGTCAVFERWVRTAQETIDRMDGDSLLPHEVGSAFGTAEARRLSSDYNNVTKQLRNHIEEVSNQWQNKD